MSRETVIRRIVRRESQKRGLTEEVVWRESPALHRSACEEFGTWDTALKYAGVGVRRLYATENYPRDLVIQKLRDYCEAGNKLRATIIMSYDRRLYDAARRHFGTWRVVQTIVAASAVTDRPPPPSRRHQKWSPQRVIEQILSRRQAGKLLHYRAVKSDQITLFWAASRYFGTWNRALRATGIEVKPWTRLHVGQPGNSDCSQCPGASREC